VPDPAGHVDTVLPPGQRVRPDHPRFGLPWYAHRGPDRVAPLDVELVGPGGARASIRETDLAGLAGRTQRSDFHCVTTWTRLDLEWAGVPFRTVYRELIRPSVDPEGSARFVCFHGVDGYHDETSLDDLLADDVLLATGLDGRPLTVRHGGPLRLVAPAHYGFKSVKHLTRIELRGNTRRRLPLASHHPRGRVAFEERFLGLPGRLIRVIYRELVLPPTLWWYRKHDRE
jgi:DMSO/TMAO reductase YedYZ molybdopterin-dependent catalytic subunit